MEIFIFIGFFVLLIVVIYFANKKDETITYKTNDYGNSNTNNYIPNGMSYRNIADEMRKAISDDKVVEIIYDKPNWDPNQRKYTTHTKTSRKIKPISVYSENQVLYLKAYCYLRNEERLFRISRIISFSIL